MKLLSAGAIAGCLLVRGGIAADAPDSTIFGSIPVVEAATLHTQTLSDAPADVTIISAEDIRRYGYLTLGDALNAVRGFFSSSDRIYDYVGVRGFLVPGDYNTRFLVMLNGHPITDQVYGSNGFFRQDLGIDMDLVKRIEVIRGPTSALYGSNGVLANINIVTRSPVDSDPLRVSTETGSFGMKKLQVSSSSYLGRGVNLLVSASMFNNTGATLDFPNLGSHVAGVDGEKGYHLFSNLVWRNWTFAAYINSRVKQPPVPWGSGAYLFARGEAVHDSRNFVEAAWSGHWGDVLVRWNTYYDQYRYDDRFYYPMSQSDAPVVLWPQSSDGGVEDLRSLARGDSVGTELTWQRNVHRIGELTAGVQLNFEIRNWQQDYAVAPAEFWSSPISHPDRTEGMFLQQQWKVSEKLDFYAGVRLDYSRNFGNSPSPRLALVYRYSPATTFKAVYGRPFRNPSAFERFYTDGGLAFLANPALRPEHAQTFEASVSRKLLRNVSVTAGYYDYHLSDLIEAIFNEAGVQQFANFSRAHSQGAEFEITTNNWFLQTSSSFSFGRTIINEDSGPAGVPSRMAKFRAATPLMKRRFWLSSSFQYLSPRTDVNNAVLGSVLLVDATISTEKLPGGFELIGGVRNLAGFHYSDPVTLALPQIPADGRSFFVKLTYRLAQ